MFIKEDLPTLERPIKAYSGSIGSGHVVVLTKHPTKSADFISISLFNFDFFI